MAVKRKVSQTKEQVSRVLNQAASQAWESLKLLEAIEKETVAKAKNLMKLPISAAERKRMTNERILASLRKLGVATQDEVNELRKRVSELEAALSSSIDSTRTTRAASDSEATEGAIPPT